MLMKNSRAGLEFAPGHARGGDGPAPAQGRVQGSGGRALWGRAVHTLALPACIPAPPSPRLSLFMGVHTPINNDRRGNTLHNISGLGF